MSNYTTCDEATHNTKDSKITQAEWHEPVDGSDLFDELVRTFHKYLSLREHQAEALSLLYK
jgi:hypothetical protein